MVIARTVAISTLLAGLLVPAIARAGGPERCSRISKSASTQLRATKNLAPSAIRAIRKQLRADPANLRAHAQRLAYLAQRNPRSADARASAEWLIVSCPSLPLLGSRAVARVQGPGLRSAWERARRRHRGALAQSNYWNHRAAADPIDLKRRRSEPRLSPRERKRRIRVWRETAKEDPNLHVVGLAAFEAWRQELRRPPPRPSVADAFDTSASSPATSRIHTAERYFHAARAADDAGFGDAADRYAGEFIARWSRQGRPKSPFVTEALELMQRVAEHQGDTSLALALREASTRVRFAEHGRSTGQLIYEAPAGKNAADGMIRRAQAAARDNDWWKAQIHSERALSFESSNSMARSLALLAACHLRDDSGAWGHYIELPVHTKPWAEHQCLNLGLLLFVNE